jgi:hypothetical protein
MPANNAIAPDKSSSTRFGGSAGARFGTDRAGDCEPRHLVCGPQPVPRRPPARGRAAPVNWPDLASLDPAATLLTAAAVLAALRWRLGTLPLLAACAAAGLAWRLLAG